MNMLEEIKQQKIQVVAPNEFMTEKEEETIFELAGFKRALDFNKVKRRELQLLENYGSFITVESIRPIALKYGMALVSTAKYTGLPGAETAEKVKNFIKVHKGKVRTENFFILCRLEDVEVVKEELRPAHADPVLFYRLSETLFFMIDQWGGEMTTARRAIVTFCKHFGFFTIWLGGPLLAYCLTKLTFLLYGVSVLTKPSHYFLFGFSLFLWEIVIPVATWIFLEAHGKEAVLQTSFFKGNHEKAHDFDWHWGRASIFSE